MRTQILSSGKQKTSIQLPNSKISKATAIFVLPDINSGIRVICINQYIRSVAGNFKTGDCNWDTSVCEKNEYINEAKISRKQILHNQSL
jgi:hypothetical protein